MMAPSLFHLPREMGTRIRTERKEGVEEKNDRVDIVVALEGDDRIGNLSDELLHHILSLMPIKYAAQTSLLSKRWRSIWASLPDLDFTTLFSSIPPFSRHRTVMTSERINSIATVDFIDEVLGRRRGKECDLRTLRFRGCVSISCLRDFISRAIRLNVQEIDMDIQTEHYFNLFRCIVTSNSLRILKVRSPTLCFGLLPPPLMIGGFRSLSSMHLCIVRMDHMPVLDDLFTEFSFPALKTLDLDVCSGLRRLRVACPALEVFSLKNCFLLCELEICGEKLHLLRVERCFRPFHRETNSYVKITAPNVTKLRWKYNAVIDNTSFDNLRSLRKASLRVSASTVPSDAQKHGGFSRLLSCVSHCNELTLNCECLEIVTTAALLGVCFSPLYGVKELQVKLSLEKDELHGYACLFENCPCVQKLTLQLTGNCKEESPLLERDIQMQCTQRYEEEKYWESQVPQLESFLHNLRVLKMKGNLEHVRKLVFFKFVLKHSVALEEVIFSGDRDLIERKEAKFKQLLHCWSSSPNAKIIFECNDHAKLLWM